MKITGPLENLPDVAPVEKTVAVLAVSPHQEDHVCLRAIIGHSNWKIFEAHACHEAMSFLSKNRIAVLVCERDLPDGDWKSLLDSLSALPLPPLLVVTSRDADDTLWAEVLNLGAYDVLPKPFDRAEVTRIISLAWLHWKEESLRRRRKLAARAAVASGIQGSVLGDGVKTVSRHVSLGGGVVAPPDEYHGLAAGSEETGGISCRDRWP